MPQSLEYIGKGALNIYQSYSKNGIVIYLQSDKISTTEGEVFAFHRSDREGNVIEGSTATMQLLCSNNDVFKHLEVCQDNYNCISTPDTIEVSVGTKPKSTPSPSSSPTATTRVSSSTIAGENRYETSCKIALEAYPSGAKGVIIASGDGYADALSASGIVGVMDYPILLSGKNSLDNQTLDTIKSLNCSEYAILVGGEEALSSQIETQIKEINDNLTILRLEGKTRYDTAMSVASFFKSTVNANDPNKTLDKNTVVIASGANYPDALSVSALSASQKIGIILCDKDSGLSNIDGIYQIKDVLKGYTNAIIVGGENAVPTCVESQLKKYCGDSMSIERWSGEDRYETSRVICNKEVELYGSSTYPIAYNNMCITSGDNYPDALSGSALASKNGTVIELVNDSNLDIASTLDKNVISEVKFLGGENAISDSTKSNILSNLE